MENVLWPMLRFYLIRLYSDCFLLVREVLYEGEHKHFSTKMLRFSIEIKITWPLLDYMHFVFKIASNYLA